jgi:Fe-S oxidoreductase
VETVTPFKEIIEEVKEIGGDIAKLCFQCGICDTVCPWNRVRDFSIRKIINQSIYGLSEVESEEMWLCSTCGKCMQRCPRGVKQIDVSVALRRLSTEYQVFPASVKPVRTVIGGLVADGNPFGEEKKSRADWAKGKSVKKFSEGTEILYFPCCYPSYDKRLRNVAVATVEILKKAGVDFGILGNKENCCGESVRKTGDEELFKTLAKENIKTFIDAGVKKILVSSPHCYHTFKNEYPEFSVNFEVVHITEFIFQLIEEGRLKLKKDYYRKLTYHDPCYLGRHNGIYNEPRDVLKHISGVELLEMPDAFENSLCCGGGGGRVWMETLKEERFSNLRIEQAVQVGAEELVTACPYCIAMLEDSRVVMNMEDKIEIKDITEIVAEVI